MQTILSVKKYQLRIGYKLEIGPIFLNWLIMLNTNNREKKDSFYSNSPNKPKEISNSMTWDITYHHLHQSMTEAIIEGHVEIK